MRRIFSSEVRGEAFTAGEMLRQAHTARFFENIIADCRMRKGKSTSTNWVNQGESERGVRGQIRYSGMAVKTNSMLKPILEKLEARGRAVVLSDRCDEEFGLSRALGATRQTSRIQELR